MILLKILSRVRRMVAVGTTMSRSCEIAGWNERQTAGWPGCGAH